MIYLPDELTKAKVLITAKTYPLPTRSYSELVSVVGLLNGEKWIRIYPVSFNILLAACRRESDVLGTNCLTGPKRVLIAAKQA